MYGLNETYFQSSEGNFKRHHKFITALLRDRTKNGAQEQSTLLRVRCLPHTLQRVQHQIQIYH